MKLIYYLSITLSVASAELFSDYKCGLCKSIAQTMIDSNDFRSSMLSICSQTFPGAVNSYCGAFHENEYLVVNSHAANAKTLCQLNEFCPVNSVIDVESSGLDVRVSKALGSHPYNTIRLSVISNHTIDSPYFTYSKQFQNAWTTSITTGPNFLNSGIVTVTPGDTTTFVIENQEVKVSIPAENAGVRGIILADPCFQSEWNTCA